MKLKFLFLILFVSVVLLGCHSPNDHSSLSQCKKHFKAQSYKVALEKCRIGAESGNLDSQWLLANLYIKGLAGEKQPEKAYEWLEEAASNGHTGAQRELGKAYLFGKHIARDGDSAVKWLKLAVREQDVEAQFLMGIYYLGDKQRNNDQASAINWFKKAAAANHKLAINNLAWIYSTSPNPSLRNGMQAVKIMQPLIKRSPDSAVLLDTLAAAFAESGDFKKAIDYQKQAIDNLKSEVKGAVRQGYLDRLKNYESNKPWRETVPEWSENEDYDKEKGEDVKNDENEQHEPVMDA
ncbi:SEL1-like repeat protein [Pleionea sediminis]|uniref:SEL1-like repeat protein n=1 Tax=Pleionea sediminis TaxID=2569479 RepID=UPI001184A9AC|nr:tetratricopeptide repeat protein [Pleionea sediminis]